MSAGWNDYDFTVTMPHQAPPLGKLSEVEFWKQLASFQWESIAKLLGRPVREICNDAGERLYASLINIELNLGEHHSLERLGEGCHIRVKNRVNAFAGRFIEGLSKANVALNRKMLSEIAIRDPEGFTQIVQMATAEKP